MAQNAIPLKGIYEANTLICLGEFQNQDYMDVKYIGSDSSTHTTTDAVHFPLFSKNTSGMLETKTALSFKFNPSTGSLSTTTFNSLSDVSLKENINPLENSMDVLKMLQPISFTWKDNGKKSYGLLAQDVEKLLPELVDTDSNGIKSVNYSALIPFLINAIVDLDK